MKKYDVAVIGGGFSGVAAAISAARGGASVILAEKSNCLGGAACNCLVNPFMCYWTFEENGYVMKKQLSDGIFNEILEEMKKLEYEIDGKTYGENKPVGTFHEEYLKLALNRMAENAGVDLLFHANLVASECEDGAVKSVTLSGKSGTFNLEARYFIDASGDADLAFLSGFGYRLGRDADNLCQPMTLCFRLSNIDIDKFHSLPQGYINNLYNKFQDEGKIKNPRENVLMFSNYLNGVIHFNSTRIVKLNPTDPFDLTKAEIEAREQVFELFLFMKRNIPGFENCELMMTAPEIGVRESRMIEGEYTLTEGDLLNLTKFDDAIAYGRYSIDIHSPDGTGTYLHHFKKDEYYSIPYRCSVPKGAENLLVAGRSISADHTAQSAVRIMPIVCCIGEGVGTAAAMAAKEAIPVSGVNTEELRRILKKNGAFIEN